MSLYEAWAIHKDKTHIFSLLSNSTTDAQNFLVECGFHVFACKRKWTLLDLKYTDKDRENFCEYMASYLKAGMTLQQSLQSLSEDYYVFRMKILCKTLLMHVEHGLKIDGVRCKDFFDDFFSENLKMAEQTGSFVKILENLAKYFKERNELRNNLQKILRYPLLVIFLMFLFMGFIFTTLLPQITDIIPPSHQGIAFKSLHMVQSHFHVFFSVLFVIMSITFYAIKKYIHRFRLLSRLSLEPFWHCLSFCLENKIPFTQSIKIASRQSIKSFSPFFQNIEQKIVSGQSANESLTELPHLTFSNKTLLKQGETTGEFHGVVKKIALHESKYKKNLLDQIILWTQPSILFMIGMLILWIICATFLPLYDSITYIQ